MSQTIEQAIAFHQAGDWPQAERLYREVLDEQPDQADALHLLGVLHHQRGNDLAAVDLIQKAIARHAPQSDYFNNLGISFRGLGRLEDAIRSYRRALEIQPHYFDAVYNLANALRVLGDIPEAIRCYETSLLLKPGAPDAHYNLASLLYEEGKLIEAEVHYRGALDSKPDYAEAWNGLAVAHRDLGNVPAALDGLRQALSLRPDYPEAHVNLSLALLLLGEYKAGWMEHEWRWKWPGYSTPQRDFARPQWQGEPLGGCVLLVHAEQGLGDALQFLRYIPLLAQRGSRILLECPPTLHPLIRAMPGVERCLTPGEPLPLFDLHVPLLSLPWIFGTTLETIPNRIPYITLPSGKALELGPTPSGSKRIGLVWAGNPGHKDDANRSVALEHFFPVLRLPGLDFYSLQAGMAAADIRTLPADIQLKDLSSRLGDFGDTAAAVAQLDLVISVDTAVVHLAGAMGKPAWVLLPYAPDWRWLLGRSDSPWYPTVRLFRQPSPGEWTRVVLQLTTALARWEWDQPISRKTAMPPPAMTLRPCFTGAIEAAGVRNDVPSANDLFRQGLRLHREDKVDEAINCYQQAVEQCPELIEAWLNWGTACRSLGRLAEAMACYEKALKLRPNHAGANLALGAVLSQQGHREEALACCQREIHYHPHNADAHYDLGLALHHLDRFDEAIEAYRHAVRLHPGHADAWANLGAVLQQRLEMPEAIRCCEQAIRLRPEEPEAHWHLSTALLLSGELRRGWPEHEWRWKMKDFSTPHWSVAQPLWRGEPLHGRTIFLHAEQGAGDILQFIRYVPLIAQRGATIIVGCPRSLETLVRTVPGVQQTVTTRIAPPPFDVHAPLLSLPAIFQTAEENIPANVPYVSPPVSPPFRLPASSFTRGKVGIVWAGSPAHRNDQNRSVSLDQFRPLFDLSDIAFFGLQVGPQAIEVARLPQPYRVEDLSPELSDYSVTASVVSQLDLVITVDTSVAHLAGALGRPVWVLIPYLPDWRWMLDRADSPWYPTLRLFRQPRRGDWENVFRRVKDELGRFFGPENLPPKPGLP